MAEGKRSVLITGCSDGGMGAALAVEFHKAGLHVYATARNLKKMRSLEVAGIETLELDVCSDDSIAACVKQIPSLDILINNAGASLSMPVADLNFSEAKELFDLNLWAQLAVTQAFLPLLLKSKQAVIANHSSVGSIIALPFQAAYNASKAALAMMTTSLRFELEPFGISVVELKTGGVKTNIVTNNVDNKDLVLPQGSIYEPVRGIVEASLRQEGYLDDGISAEEWAKGVAKDLLKTSPPHIIWRGSSATLIWISKFLPTGLFDGTIKKLTRLDQVTKIIQAQSGVGKTS